MVSTGYWRLSKHVVVANVKTPRFINLNANTNYNYAFAA